ncbi:MAG: hypothetical protein H0T92_24845, partial [Pyrinomonadaceae bacterium]|nr:hypothetical protein [Pyrinomonadaceae bacterium]
MKQRTVKLFLATPALAFVAFIAGCATTERAATAGADSTAKASPSLEPVTDVTEAGPAFRAAFATEPAEAKAGEPVTLSFTVKDAKGAPVRDLQVVHEKPMHLLVISSDLAEFYHLHPEPHPDGTYRVRHTFPSGGAYKLYADFTPPGGDQIVDQHNLMVAGDERPRTPLVEDKTQTKRADSLRVTMRPDKPLRAGNEVMLNFAIADAKTGKPATDLQPYLGALAHFVIISEDTTDFLHAHPMTRDEMSDMSGMQGHGDDHGSTPHSHDPAELKQKAQAQVSQSEVAAHTIFPRAGLYKVWAQFKRSGQVITVLYVVHVAGGENVRAEEKVGSSGANQPAPTDAIKVSVSSAGYTPSRIEVQKGKPIKLAFYRSDGENCG